MNTQILSFENIEADTLRREVNVNYTLEGESKRLDIPFDHLTNFLTQHRVKVAGYNDDMGIEELDILWWSEQTLENTTQAFIRNYEKFDLIVENRKLRDKALRYDSVISGLKCAILNIEDLEKDSKKAIEKRNWFDLLLPGFNRHLGACLVYTSVKRILQILKEDFK